MITSHTSIVLDSANNTSDAEVDIYSSTIQAEMCDQAELTNIIKLQPSKLKLYSN